MKQISLCIAAALLFTSCGRFGNTDNKKDQQERIVCISKQYNEIIFALGAQQNLVAVDVSSTYPPEIKKLPTVGYHRALSAEGITSQNPTLLLHDNNVGPEHVMKQLKDLKIPMRTFADSVVTIEQTKALIREMGAYFHKEQRAAELCNKLDSDMHRALNNAQQYSEHPKVMVIHFGQAMNVYMAMTRKSNAAKMINWAGGTLDLDGVKGMQQLSPEIVAQADPDVVLLTDFGYDRLGSIDKIKELPGLAGTKAAKSNRIYRVEEHDMVYLGPRTGENVLLFQELIHRHAPSK